MMPEIAHSSTQAEESERTTQCFPVANAVARIDNRRMSKAVVSGLAR
jgi:hypothetical protein